MYWDTVSIRYNEYISIEVFEEIHALELGVAGFKAELFLCGSASFPFSKFFEGGVSDIDVAMRENAAIENYLVNNDWEELRNKDSAYADSFTKTCYEKIISGQRVQISIKTRKRFESFRLLWRALPEDLYKKFLYKKSPTYLGKEGVRSFLEDLDLFGTWYAEGFSRSLEFAPPQEDDFGVLDGGPLDWEPVFVEDLAEEEI